mgnify:CR=1 FL=1
MEHQHLCLAHRLVVDVDVEERVRAHRDAKAVLDVAVDELESVLGEVRHPRLGRDAASERVHHAGLEFLVPGAGAHHRAARHDPRPTTHDPTATSPLQVAQPEQGVRWTRQSSGGAQASMKSAGGVRSELLRSKSPDAHEPRSRHERTPENRTVPWALRPQNEAIVPCGIQDKGIINLKDIKDVVASPHFERAIAIVKVNRNKETNTNPLLNSKIDEEFFQKALGASLEKIGLLATGQSSTRFNLIVHLESFKQSLFGKDYKVTSAIKYRLVEKRTETTLYEELISTSFNTPYSKSGLPVGGMRLANEGAVRENIKEFITQLLKKNSLGANENSATPQTPDPLSAIQKLHDLQKAMDEGLIKEEKSLDLLLHQLRQFPNGKHDDLVDSFTQALRVLPTLGSGKAVWRIS